MLHAEAIERLADAATERRGIDRVLADPSSDPALREHIASCAICQREVRAWQQTAAALLLASPAAHGAVVDLGSEAPPLPAEAKNRLLAAVKQTGDVHAESEDVPVDATAVADPLPAVPATSPATRRPGRSGWLALAAAALVLVFAGGALLGGVLGSGGANSSADQLRLALAASGQILSQPGHRQAPLVDESGKAVGAVIVDGQNGDIVVLSTGGDADSNTEYHCYLVRDGERTWLGEMEAQAGTSFWAGQVDKVSDLGRTGDIIQVVGGDSEPGFSATF